MTPHDPANLSGLARSIAGLFDSEGGLAKPAPGREPVPERAAPVREATAPGATPAREVLEAVDSFLSALPEDRPPLADRIRDAARPGEGAADDEALADAVERLVRGAGDPPDPSVVGVARDLLTSAVSGRLAARLRADREEPRWSELVQACVTLGPDMVVALAEALSEGDDVPGWQGLAGAMATMGETALPALESMVVDPRWFVARNAVTVLGESGGTRAVELIISTLAHPDGRVRREALHALAKVGGEDAGMLVHGMLEDPDPDVRVAAATAAGALKVERAVRPLVSLLDEETDPQVLVGILGALGELADPGSVPAIEKRAVGSFLSRQPTSVRIAAYRALHGVGTPRAKSLLVRAANDKDPSVKAAVRRLLNIR